MMVLLFNLSVAIPARTVPQPTLLLHCPILMVTRKGATAVTRVIRNQERKGEENVEDL